MVTVGKRVETALTHWQRGEFELAMTEACIAIDLTSQRASGTSHSAPSTYKEFVHTQLPIIGLFAMSIAAVHIHVGTSHSNPRLKPNDDGTYSLQDIVYHAVRCGLVHSDGFDKDVILDPTVLLAVDQGGRLRITPQIVLGLLAAVVFAPCNKDEQAGELCWLQIRDFRYFLNDLWGRPEIIHRILVVGGY